MVIQLWRRMTEGCSMGRTATMEEQQAFTTRQGEHRLLNGRPSGRMKARQWTRMADNDAGERGETSETKRTKRNGRYLL